MMKQRAIPVLLTIFFIACITALPAHSGEKEKKEVYAHRGASGYLPEHTLPAYAMAHAMEADFIEPDLVLTKDGVFVCVHDYYLEDTTNAAILFPRKARHDGHWYVIDFTLAEIKSLSVHERSIDGKTAAFKGRFPMGKSKFEIATFREMMELVQGLNKSRSRNTGIIPELKQPSFHAKEGLPVEERFIRLIREYGYMKEGAPVIVQCFEPETLKKLRKLGCTMPLMQLVSEPDDVDPVEKPFTGELNEKNIAEIAAYATILSPHKSRIEKNPAIVEMAHKAGLKVGPYTFRADALPRIYSSFDQELYQFYMLYGVDSLFTDFPDKAVTLLRALNMR
ncbi:MAG: glycerophosphodiester phosphodiesterase [Candidatus Eremiobacteraeota bacterium]|nr:glycerophosphodiester phosphodiesterase [Candidatus Eremiobacteraeota bacterium]